MVVIVVLGLLFRLFNFEKGFSFAHDQDLYSWIVKDIIVNHHQRLVGQITSVEGVFIGSAYYYVMALFYWIFRLNPLSAVIPTVAGGLITIGSIYWVIKRHFGKKAGIIGAFIYSVSFGLAAYDRWSVPTQPTMLWSVWYLLVILEALRGNKKIIYLYAVMLGLLWQIHIALLPVSIIPLLAYGFKKIEFKRVLIAGGIFLLTCSPFFMFEIRHNFSQTKSMIAGSQKEMGGPTGKMKVIKVLNASGRELQTRLFFGWDKLKYPEYIWLLYLILVAVVYYRRKEWRRTLVILSLWPTLMLLVQFWSKRIVSEYYFSNILPVWILVLSIALGEIKRKYILIALGVGYGLTNFWWLLTKSDVDHSYYYRNKLVKAIKADVSEKKYPCIAVNFIADPGFAWGFRYLWWYNGVKVVKAATPNIPIYNVFVPAPLGDKDKAEYFGRFGLVRPTNTNKLVNPIDCDKAEYQLEPMLGYVE
jgi:hypothetical protein